MRFRAICLVVPALLVFAAGTLDAQSIAAPKPWEAPAFSAAPKDIVTAAAAIKPQQYAIVTILNEERRVIFDTSERVVVTNRLFYRVEAKDALVGWGTVRATWSPWRQKRPVIR